MVMACHPFITMEQDPSRPEHRIASFRLQFGERDGDQYMICTRLNTYAFLHKDRPELDHLYLYPFVNTEGFETAQYIWRELVQDFDEIIQFMSRNNYAVKLFDKPTPDDQEAFEEFKYAQKIRREAEAQRNGQTKEPFISNRYKKHIAFLEYLLEKELLEPQDFHRPGDLYI